MEMQTKLMRETAKEIEREIELAELMIKDLQKIWSSYAKKALEAKQERELRQAKKGFLQYETEQELIDAFGYGDIDDDTYHHGLDYFANLKKPPELSVIELHRKKLKEMLASQKSTLKMLRDELNPTEEVPQENAFDRLAREEREERYKLLAARDSTGLSHQHFMPNDCAAPILGRDDYTAPIWERFGTSY